jgi:hypothetical protein
VEVIPPGYNFLFMEPEVTQTITYISKIPDSIRYILVHVEFHYDIYTPHTAERVFQLNDITPVQASEGVPNRTYPTDEGQ